jgi:hypothetical protein
MSIATDPITLEVMTNAVYSIAEEMSIALIRTGRSTNIKDKRDASCALYTTAGEIAVISQSEIGTPLHLGVMGPAVDTTLKKIPIENLEPGDTYAKLLDTGGISQPVDLSDNLGRKPLRPQDERGRSFFDARHRFVASYAWQLPIGRGRAFGKHWSEVLNQILGEWQLSRLDTLQSGMPINPVLSTDKSNTGLFGDRPDVVSNPNNGPTPAPLYYLLSTFIIEFTATSSMARPSRPSTSVPRCFKSNRGRMVRISSILPDRQIEGKRETCHSIRTRSRCKC